MAFWAAADQNPTFDDGVYGGTKAPGAPTATYTDDKLARDKYQQALNEAFAFGPNAKAATVMPSMLDSKYADQSRAYLTDQASMLSTIAQGGAGGVSDPTARANILNAQKANQAYAVSRGGANPAATMRTLGNTNAAMSASAEARIAAMKAQEQQAADAALASNLAATRAGDQSQAFESAKLDSMRKLADAAFQQQTGLANQGAWQAGHGLKGQAVGASHEYDVGAFNNDMARKRAVAGDADWRSQFNYLQDQNDAARKAELVNTGAKITTMYAKGSGK